MYDFDSPVQDITREDFVDMFIEEYFSEDEVKNFSGVSVKTPSSYGN